MQLTLQEIQYELHMFLESLLTDDQTHFILSNIENGKLYIEVDSHEQDE